VSLRRLTESSGAQQIGAFLGQLGPLAALLNLGGARKKEGTE
jgi:hypothetical protein